MKPTPTPRTDAIEFQGWPDDCIPKLARLARELERELAAERALADEMASQLDHAQYIYDPNGCKKALAAWKEARRGTV